MNAIKINLPSWQMDAFEPLVSSETMYVHVHKLHKGYVDKLNKRFLSKKILNIPPSVVLNDLKGYLDEKDQDFYRNMMGGNLTHTLFWKILNPKPNHKYKSKLLSDFGISKKEFINEIINEGMTQFGSGWVWVCIDQGGRLKIYSTKNHDTPYMRGYQPLICVDLWEHAYFLDQYGDRKKWLENITQFLDFEMIDKIYTHRGDLIDQFVLNA
jgi:Fe-Mn family superoxide dismutase